MNLFTWSQKYGLRYEFVFSYCSRLVQHSGHIDKSPPISQESVFNKFKEHVSQQKFSTLGRIFCYKRKIMTPQKLVEKPYWTSLKPFDYEEIICSSHIVK